MDKTGEQDGGWPGRIAVVSVWTKGFIWVAILKGLGILLPTFQEEFLVQTWILGWMSSLLLATIGLTGNVFVLFYFILQRPALNVALLLCRTQIV